VILPLGVGPHEKTRAAEILAFAEANPLPHGLPPADGRRFSMIFPPGWRVSFTLSHAVSPDGLLLCRHLTVLHERLVTDEGVVTIARLFGFTGDPNGWWACPYPCPRPPLAGVVILQPVCTVDA